MDRYHFPWVEVVGASVARATRNRKKQSRRAKASLEQLEERRLLSGVVCQAVNDAFSVNEDTALVIAAPGVLTNDTDPENDPLTAVLDASTTNGALVLNADGSFNYTPSANFNGSDTFTYHANDGTSDSNVASVTITVNPVNDAPVAADDAQTTAEDTPLTVAAPGVLANDADADGDALTAVLDQAPAHGTLNLSADGSFTYTPAVKFNGADSFTYHANDGSANSGIRTVTLTVTGVNDAPVALNDGFSVDEDTPLVVAAPGVLSNDTDPEGDALTIVLDTPPTKGDLVLNADGSFNYTPNVANFNGTDTFTYHANDGSLDSNIGTVTITINAANDAPVAVDDAQTTAEDTPLTVAAPGVLANDTDIESNPLTVVLDQGPAHGTLNLSSDGSFTYTPAADFNGSDTFTYHANDGAADSNIATVTITVTPVNDAPVAVDSGTVTDEDVPVFVPAPGVLAADSDVDGDVLTPSVVTPPAHGTVEMNADGSFTYTPELNWNGVDSFTYKVNDGQLDSNIATVWIPVTSVNDAPLAVNDSGLTDEDVDLTVPAPGILANDSDAEGSPLIITLLSSTSNGTLTLSPDGSYTYDPMADWHGADFFTYKISDGALDSGTATVMIIVSPVNDAPVARDDSAATDEDTALVVDALSGALSNDSDIDGDPLTAALVDNVLHGVLTFNADGSYTYAPDENFNGTDTFTYRANDGAADSSTATVTITVNPVNDAPVANDDATVMDEDAVLIVDPPGVLANDADVDGDVLSVVQLSMPVHGELFLRADGSLIYTPEANYFGTDSFEYLANDGQADSGIAIATVTINAVNDVPVSLDDGYRTRMGVELAVDAATGVLSNDSDVEGSPLTAVLVSDPAHGTLVLNGDGSFTYTPAAGFNGLDSFTYKANDGSDDGEVTTVNIIVNTVPVAADDTAATDEDTEVTIPAPGVLANDTDADGTALSAALADAPLNGAVTLNADGSFTYTPNADFCGTDTFTYVASDGYEQSLAATVTITVNPINDAPVADHDVVETDEDVPLTLPAPGVLANDIDIDSPVLTPSIVQGPVHGTVSLSADGSFIYTPGADFYGADDFAYVVNDGSSDSNVAVVFITVNPVNDAPAAADDTYAATEETELVVSGPGLLSNDSDVENNPITAELVSGPAHGTLNLNADGSFTYAPEVNFFGQDSFTYCANDGSASGAAATVYINVANTNDAPLPVGDEYTMSEDGTLTTAAPGPIGNDADPDGDALTTVLYKGPLNGSLTLNADGSFTYTPNPGFVGKDLFRYRVSDGQLTSDDVDVVVTVQAVEPSPNISPSAADFAVVRDVDGGAMVAIQTHASDPDDDPLAIDIVTAPAYGRAFVNSNGTPLDFTDDLVEYLPKLGWQGKADSFTYRVSDGRGGSATAKVTIKARSAGYSPNAYDSNKKDLVVVGTSGNDKIKLTKTTTGIKAALNGKSLGVFNPTGKIVAKGLGGNDTITAVTLGRPVEFYGGAGNDTLTGSNKKDVLDGGSGVNRIIL